MQVRKHILTCFGAICLWGFIQLLVMGLLIHFRSVVLIVDLVHGQTFSSEEKMFEAIDNKVHYASTQCYLASGLFLISFILIRNKEHLKKLCRKCRKKRPVQNSARDNPTTSVRLLRTSRDHHAHSHTHGRARHSIRKPVPVGSSEEYRSTSLVKTHKKHKV